MHTSIYVNLKPLLLHIFPDNLVASLWIQISQDIFFSFILTNSYAQSNLASKTATLVKWQPQLLLSSLTFLWWGLRTCYFVYNCTVANIWCNPWRILPKVLRLIPELPSLYLEGKNIIISEDPEKIRTSILQCSTSTPLPNPLYNAIFLHHTKHEIHTVFPIFLRLSKSPILYKGATQ